MTDALVDAGTDVDAAPASVAVPVPRLRWWRELVYIAGFYAVYTAVRNTQGSATVSAERAFHNARRVIRVERVFGIYHEHQIQHVFLGHRLFLQFWDVFYGTAHFVVTAGALIFMFRAMKGRYPLWRNTLACTTALALVGFALYPLMPPRLLPTHYGFVDTLRVYGGLWSFDSGAMQKISNQYAAMPSLHFAWSSWCAFVLYPATRRWWTKALVVAYPFITLFAIVVTANHYVLDAVGGAVVLGLGYLLGRAITAYNASRAAT
ncbi:MAG TPA: phosphatase PAP2 family protein [Acidimicrobiales bacterium]|nr:phosphatase PAP2 family protein [Acidimicrobiales bacterium]